MLHGAPFWPFHATAFARNFFADVRPPALWWPPDMSGDAFVDLAHILLAPSPDGDRLAGFGLAVRLSIDRLAPCWRSTAWDAGSGRHVDRDPCYRRMDPARIAVATATGRWRSFLTHDGTRWNRGYLLVDRR
jgi:hypothetical protein